jgi:hypothetical protein
MTILSISKSAKNVGTVRYKAEPVMIRYAHAAIYSYSKSIHVYHLGPVPPHHATDLLELHSTIAGTKTNITRFY